MKTLPLNLPSDTITLYDSVEHLYKLSAALKDKGVPRLRNRIISALNEYYERRGIDKEYSKCINVPDYLVKLIREGYKACKERSVAI